MIAGTTGEVFNLGGKVAGVIPASGRPEAIRFTVGYLHPATSIAPAWADVDVRRPDGSHIAVRIDPSIFDSSLFRFYDLIKIAATETKRILDLQKPNRGRFSLQGETFFVWPERMRSPFGVKDVVMIDRESRLIAHHHTSAGDGQHKHGVHATEEESAEQRRKRKKEDRRRRKRG